MNPEFSNSHDETRYEVHVGDRLAGFAAYRMRGDRVVFTHTEIGDDFEGQGLGSKLARFALDDIRARGLEAAPLCPFVRAYIARHPEYLDLVVEDMREEVAAAVKSDG